MGTRICGACLLVVVIGNVLGMPMPTLPPDSQMDMQQVEEYFLAYNYMGRNMPDKVIADMYETNRPMAFYNAAMFFQRRAGLAETGQLDEDTMRMMSMPRCAMPDLITMDDMEMPKLSKYSIQGGKWPKTDLTYQITLYSKHLTRSQVDQEIRRAFDVWQDKTPLTFTIYNPATPGSVLDIEIQFVAPYVPHGDGSTFDGPSGVLAHAYFPGQGQISGDAHFDEGETWTIATTQGINLFQVAAHEFGHSLGLGHSRDSTALMAPFYQGYQPAFTLPTDDTLGIQALYGIGTKPPAPRCPAPKFDAVATIKNSRSRSLETYVFSGRHYHVMDSEGRIDPEDPRLISETWPQLPNDLEAAIYWPNSGTTFVFKDSSYWQINERRVMNGPEDCKDLPANMDAAMYFEDNDKSYFFKGSEYYRYTEGSGVDAGYPKDISLWYLPSSGIDGAVLLDGENYFFKGDQYYLYMDSNVKELVVEGDEYPKPITDKFVDCESSGVRRRGGRGRHFSRRRGHHHF